MSLEQQESLSQTMIKEFSLPGADLQGGPIKRGHRLMAIILSFLNRFKNFFST